MVKWIKALTVLVVCLALLVVPGFGGCSLSQGSSSGQDDAASADNPFVVNPNEGGSDIVASFIYGPVQYTDGPTLRSVIYDGSPIEVTYEFDCTGPAADQGLLVFIDGVLQRYHTDHDADNSYLHIHHFETGDHTDILVSVDPTVGSQGQTLNLNAVVINNPRYQPDPTQPVVFGHNLRCGSGICISVEYQTDSTLTEAESTKGSHVEDISQAMRDSYVAEDLSFDEARLTLGGIDTTYQKVEVNNNCRIAVTGVGGADKDYRLYLFCNLEPYVFADGSQYVDFPIRVGKATNFDYDLDLRDLDSGDTVTVFGLAVPILEDPEDFTAFVLQTPRYLLVKE